VEGNDLNKLSEEPTTFSLLKSIKGKKILDAGCGSGIYSKKLAQKGAKVYGLELNQNMINLAKNYCKNLNIEFKQGSIDKIPYPDNNFDIVLASLVIHYLKKPERAIKEFRRVLKDNGELILSTTHPIVESFIKIKDNGRKKEILITDYFKKGKYYWSLHNSKVKIPSYRMGFERLSRLLSKSGFFIQEIKEATLNKKLNLPAHLKKFIGCPIFIIIKSRKIK
ncbi:MAG: class I SAM-dependent methyltransferase, partial [Nanoarchaeota archaeon]|nr:class I SAM-dependent methyltransferase [Nanoarchaeota archaeon]